MFNNKINEYEMQPFIDETNIDKLVNLTNLLFSIPIFCLCFSSWFLCSPLVFPICISSVCIGSLSPSSSLSLSPPNSYSQATVQCIKVHVTSGVCMCWMTNALRLSDCLVCQTDAVGTMVDSCLYCLNEGEVCGACLCHQPSAASYMAPLRCLT